MPKFIGFDIWRIDSCTFLPYTALKEEFDRLEIPVVPLLFKGKISEIDITRLENFIGKSAYYDGTMEGIVMKNYMRKSVFGRQLFAKIVTQAFKENNMVAFGGGIKSTQDDTTKFIEGFYTEARIRKAVYRLKDEQGLKLERGLMHYLPKAVIEDIFKEEGWTVIKEFNSIRFDIVKKNAPKLCLQELDKIIKEEFLVQHAKAVEGVNTNAL